MSLGDPKSYSKSQKGPITVTSLDDSKKVDRSQVFINDS